MRQPERVAFAIAAPHAPLSLPFAFACTPPQPYPAAAGKWLRALAIVLAVRQTQKVLGTPHPFLCRCGSSLWASSPAT